MSYSFHVGLQCEKTTQFTTLGLKNTKKPKI
jgi:hypothetical protein